MARVPISMSVGRQEVLLRSRELHARPRGRSSARRPSSRTTSSRAGLNSIGILTGGGLGRVMAHWIINGRPDVDVTAMNIDRLHAYQTNPEYRRTRTVESLGMVYKCHYPTHSMTTARGAKQSPFYERLAARGAYFRDVSGWEGADWYEPELPRIDRAHVGHASTGSRTWAGRAPRRARGRDPDGHVVHVEVPRRGTRRGRASRTGSARTTSTAPPARSPTPSGSTRPASCRPISPSPSSPTTSSGSSPPTPRTATSRRG